MKYGALAKLRVRTHRIFYTEDIIAVEVIIYSRFVQSIAISTTIAVVVQVQRILCKSVAYGVDAAFSYHSPYMQNTCLQNTNYLNKW